MNKISQAIKNDFPRTPAILFSLWIGWIVITDLLQTMGFLPEKFDFGFSDDGAVVHYVKFKTVNLGEYSVFTGTQFAANDGNMPEKEWCYADAKNLSGEHRINITLASINGNSEILYESVSSSSANALGLTPEEVKEIAINHCHFYGG